MNAIQKALTRLERGVLAAAKDAMQRVPDELYVATSEFLRDTSNSASDGLRIAKSKARYFTKPNTTKRLRSLYGNIERSLIQNEKGNVSDVTIKNGIFTVAYGYDPSTSVQAGPRTTTLKYAVINEGKGRPFLDPGFRKYMSDAQGFKALMKELEADILELA